MADPAPLPNPSVPVSSGPAPVSDPVFIASHQKMSQAMADSAEAVAQMAAASAVVAGTSFTPAQVWLSFAVAACEGKLTASSNDMAAFADDMLAEFKTRYPTALVP